MKIVNSVTDTTRYRSVLCLDGGLPDKEFFEFLGLPIVAADGAANLLSDMGIKADIIIGDLDSVSNDVLQSTNYVQIEDQDFSDFQKACSYINKNGLAPAIVCGVGGGHIDHIFNNVSIFSEAGWIFVDKDIVGFTVHGVKEFTLPANTKLSLVALPECLLTTSGLKWDLSGKKLSFPGYNSCFNRTLGGNVTIDVSDGTAILFVYRNSELDKGNLSEISKA